MSSVNCKLLAKLKCGANNVDRSERMLDRALMLQDLYRHAWEQERNLKWTLAELLLDAAVARDAAQKELKNSEFELHEMQLSLPMIGK